jgi:NAD(P)-dependent dehydrogenase (short-subunit alcohol dehydrogenase family)/acyl carrier protein
VLTAAVTETAEAAAIPVAVTGTLRRGEDTPARLLTSAAHWWVTGGTLDFTGLYPNARPADLPTYAFQHHNYWPRPRPATAPAEGAGGPFWDALDRGDIAAVAGTLAIPEEPLREVVPALASWRRRQAEEAVLSGWRYRIAWSALSPALTRGTSERGASLRGSWLLLVPEGADHPWISAAAEAIRTAGGEVSAFAVDTDGTDGTDGGESRAEIGRRLAGLSFGDLAGVISLLALDESPHPGHPVMSRGLARTLTCVQALGDARMTVPLWLVTCAAVTTGRAGELVSPVQAQTWGFGRVLGLEHPERWGGLIDLPATPAAQAGAALAAALASAGDEDQLAVRGSDLLARRLVRAPASGPPARDWHPGGPVLITGGTGALGGQVARWLAARGASKLILASRQGSAAPGADELVAELGALGSAAVAAAVDIADREQVSALLADLERAGTPVRAVVHCAGVVEAGRIDDTTAGDFARVMSAKVAGAAHLHELLGDDLDAFILFTSNAGVWGSGGQAAYAAANAYLDALASRRRSCGRPATAIAWGAWRGGGMASRDDAEQQLLRRGIRPMAPERAVAALARAMDDDETFLAVADVDWAQFAKSFTAARRRPLISDLPEVRQAMAGEQETDEPAGDAGAASLASRLAALPPAEQERVVTDHVRSAIASVLGYAAPGAVDTSRPFKDLGFDSLTSLELRNQLNARTGLRLSATVVFDHPTPAELARVIRASLVGDTEPGPVALARIDQLDAIVSVISQDDDVRTVIAGRLRAMLAKLGERGETRQGSLVAQQLETATDDEIFDFIHRELGR